MNEYINRKPYRKKMYIYMSFRVLLTKTILAYKYSLSYKKDFIYIYIPKIIFDIKMMQVIN